jgi:DNA-binding CsgD family transcriptional regulator
VCGKITFTPYTKEERDALIEACGLTDRQKEVFVTRAQTDSLIATAQRLHISPETVKRESRRVQDKINRVRARQRRQTECFAEADKTSEKKIGEK